MEGIHWFKAILEGLHLFCGGGRILLSHSELEEHPKDSQSRAPSLLVCGVFGLLGNSGSIMTQVHPIKRLSVSHIIVDKKVEV